MSNDTVFANGLMRQKLQPRKFPNCCDCRVKLTQDNISTHQPIRCQECWVGFADRTTTFLESLVKGGKGGAG